VRTAAFIVTALYNYSIQPGNWRTQRTDIYMAENHKHGEMDTTVQEKTFDGFIKWSVRVSIIAICVLIFMALVNS
jgi:hypothetical protein